LIQTFDRYRRGNKQTVEVRHVRIHSGGQGVVGPAAICRGSRSSTTCSLSSDSAIVANPVGFQITQCLPPWVLRHS
jgi:hypothetical protein